MSFESKPTYKEPSEAEKQQTSEDIKKKALEALKQKLAIVDASHLAEMEARDAANAYMTESKGKAGFWKKLVRHSLLEPHYRNKKLNEVRAEIIKTGNIYTAVEQDKKAHENAMNAITSRFISEYEEVINKKLGEERGKLKEDDASIRTKGDIKKLISDYAKSGMTEEVFTAEKNRIFKNINHDSLKGATTYADNLFEMAKNAKLAVEHGAKLEELDASLENIVSGITVGKAKSSIKTEARNNTVDKIVSGIKSTKIGRYVNPVVMSTALGIVFSIGVFAGKTTLRSKLSHAMTFGGTAVASGLLAGANESQRLAHERMQHQRERAKGGVAEGDSPRREKMEEYSYQTESASKLMKTLRDSIYTKDANGKEVAKQITQAELDTVMNNITEIENREALSNERKIDLITYSSPANVEKERTEMVILLARAKDEMRNQMTGHLKGTLAPGESFDTRLVSKVKTAEKVLLGGEEGITKQDAKFRNHKLKRAAVVAGKTVLIGVTVGAAVQEAHALADGMWGGHKEGFIEGLWHGGGETTNHVQTPLDHLISGRQHISMEGAHEQLLNNSHFKLPEGAEILSNPDGTYNIVLDGDRVISDHISITTDASGALDQATIDRLGEDGIIANTTHNLIEGTGDTVMNPSEYVQSHPDQTTHIARDGWYDNNTPKPVFDKNELKLHWGGENNTGVNADGKIVFNVAHMTQGGSFHDSLSVDAQEKIKSGGLKMFLSLTRDTQMNPFPVDIDANGNAIIDPNSEVGKLFFSVDDKGHAVFQGRFAEVSETFGTDANGRLHVRELATYEGPDHGPITVTGPKDVDIPVNHIQLPLDRDPPIFLPFIPRRPLEPIFYKPPMVPNEPADRTIIQTYYNGASLNEIQREFKERGINNNPYIMIELQNGRKIWVDKNNKEISRDAVRERARFVAYFEKQNKEYLKELNDFNADLEPMSKDCRVSVIIPARFEEKNLKNLLDQYVKQVDENGDMINKDLFEINIIVNRKEGEVSDRSMEIIREWKLANPGYHVNAIDKTFSKENANVGTARKYITDLSLMRSLARGESTGPLYIESEDADLFSVDKRTIGKLIKDFDNKPYLDVLRGIQDRQPEVMSKNDLFFFERRLWDFGEMLMRDESLRSDKFDKSSFVWNRIISGGWNTAYTAEVYAEIGGYVPDVIGEDMKIGQKISVLRGSEDKNKKFVFNTYTAETSGLRANSSPRRFLDAMAKQESPYDNFDDQSVKEKTLDELLGKLKSYELISPEHKSRYEAGVNTFFRFMMQEMGKNEESKKVMTRVLASLGFKKGVNPDYTIENNEEVKITDKGFEKIGKLLATYKEEERWKLGYRRQNSPLEDVTSIPSAEDQEENAVAPAPTNSVENEKGNITENSNETSESNQRAKTNENRKTSEKLKRVAKKKTTIRKVMNTAKERSKKKAPELVVAGSKRPDGSTPLKFVTREALGSPKLKTELRTAFEKILEQNGGRAKISQFDMDIVDNKIVVKAELNAGFMGGKPIIDMKLEVKDGKIAFSGNPVIRANNLARGPVNEAVLEIPTKIKEILGENRNGKVSEISIENNELKIGVE